MDLFFLSWAFDRRWLFKIKNPLNELIFTVPFLINLGTAVLTYIEKAINTDERVTFFIEDLILLSLLAISNLYLIYMVRSNAGQKLKNIRQNYVAIQDFYHDYEMKKIIWSLIGLIITFIAICQSVTLNLLINRNQQLYSCFSSKIRYSIDYFFYVFIVCQILLFLIIKAMYLCSAWVFCPKTYLKLKRIID